MMECTPRDFSFQEEGDTPSRPSVDGLPQSPQDADAERVRAAGGDVPESRRLHHRRDLPGRVRPSPPGRRDHVDGEEDRPGRGDAVLSDCSRGSPNHLL